MLKDRCHINTNRKTDTFVGLEFDGKDYTVSFPLGYAIASEDDDKLLREDLLLLFHTLALYSSQTESKSGFKREKRQGVYIRRRKPRKFKLTNI